MSEYTEESLDKMLKRDLIPIVHNLQTAIADKNNSKNELLEEIRKVNDNFSKLQSELAITKQVNTELTRRIVTLERQCWVNAQYSRKECLEVVGITCEVDDNRKQRYFQFLRNLVAQLILVLLMIIIALARIVTEL